MPTAAVAPVTIKLATQVPVNSTWHKALLDMGAQWDTKTSSRVKLTVYAGGTQGDEPSTIRMMRPGVDQLQANLLMVSGLAQLDEAFNVFGMPFFFQSDEEAAYVQGKLTPLLQKKLDAKGFRLLCWAQRRLGAALLEEADSHARRGEAGQALHEPGRRQDGAVVQDQRASTLSRSRPMTSRRS